MGIIRMYGGLLYVLWFKINFLPLGLAISISRIKRSTLNVPRSVFNVTRSVFRVQRSTFCIPCSVFNVPGSTIIVHHRVFCLLSWLFCPGSWLFCLLSWLFCHVCYNSQIIQCAIWKSRVPTRINFFHLKLICFMSYLSLWVS